MSTRAEAWKAFWTSNSADIAIRWSATRLFLAASAWGNPVRLGLYFPLLDEWREDGRPKLLKVFLFFALDRGALV